jgi:hypothetical protein
MVPFWNLELNNIGLNFEPTTKGKIITLWTIHLSSTTKN